jgi:hypothetical protein
MSDNQVLHTERAVNSLTVLQTERAVNSLTVLQREREREQIIV